MILLSTLDNEAQYKRMSNETTPKALKLAVYGMGLLLLCGITFFGSLSLYVLFTALF